MSLNKKTVTLSSVMTLAATLGSSAAFAGRYDGPAVDFNFVNQKPAKYSECDQYLNDSNARRYAACEFGRDEAERMANRFGGGNGRVQGYLRGFAWGMHKMSNAYSNDAREVEAGARLVDGMGSQMESGLNAGRKAARDAGQSRGQSDAIERFLSVLNTGREPDPTVRVPKTFYEGEDDAYRKYVGPIPTPQQIIKKEVSVGELRVYDSWDATYLGEKQPLSVWDLWFDNGTYVFEKARWFDENLAFQTWQKRPIDTRPKYDNLNNPPLLDANGLAVDLKGVFSRAFINSYAWYVNYYFSSEFQKSLEDGTLAGEQVGTQVGKRVAQYVGLERAFNAKFKESAAAAYHQAFSQLYTQGFQAVFNDYAQNPKLSIEFDDVVGEDNDGILQPGERFGAKFRVKNIGGVGATLNVSVGGNVVDSNPQVFSIARLRSAAYEAPQIGRIDPRLRSRDTARIILDVNGLKAEQREQVNQMIAISEAAPRLAISKGAGEVTLVANNIATVRTPGMVSAELAINGTRVATQQLGFIERGESQSVSLQFSGVDPLLFLTSNVTGTVTIKMGSVTMDEASVSLNPIKTQVEMTKYFDALANGEGFVPSTKKAEDRFVEVRGMISKINNQEIDEHHKSIGVNPWKSDPGSQIVGKVLAQFNSRHQSEAAKDQYDVLARQLWKARTKFNKVMIFFSSPRRKAYQRIVKQFSRGNLD